MKRSILFLAGLAMGLGACHHEGDTLVGTWSVDKVHVQFDEQRTTPELVRQVGEMERQNTLSIDADSTLLFKGFEETLQGRLHLQSDGTLLVDGAAFGTWKNGRIVTTTPSPLGICLQITHLALLNLIKGFRHIDIKRRK